MRLMRALGFGDLGINGNPANDRADHDKGDKGRAGLCPCVRAAFC